MSNVSLSRAWDETRAFLTAERRIVAAVALSLIALPAAVVSVIAPQETGGAAAELNMGLPILLLALVTMVGQLAIARLALGYEGPVGGAIALAFRRLPILFVAVLLVVLPLVLALMAIFAGAGIDPEAPAGAATAAHPAVTLLMIPLIGAFVWVAVRMMLATPAAAAETGGPIHLLKASFRLTRGNFWRLLAFVLLILVAFFAVVIAVQAVIGGLLLALVGPRDPLSLTALLLGLVEGVLQAAFATLYVAMLSRIYRQLAA